jgi:hypothetical protein
MTADDVVWELTRRAWRFGVSVLLSPEATVDSGDGFKCGGFFCDQTRRLAVATGRSEDAWVGVLIHEYAHLTQWIEGAPVWRSVKEGMWDWIDGKAIKNPREAVRTVQELEADCERRAIRMIRELDAPVDLEKYTRTANAYIHFHNVIADKRKWYRPGTVMSEIASLRAAANPTFDTDFTKTSAPLRSELEKLL